MEYVVISIVLFIIFILFTLPPEIEPPDNLCIKMEKDEMSKKFNVTLNWTPSSDDTVTEQVLTITVGGTALPVVNLGPKDETHQFQADQKEAVVVKLVASNGPHVSAPLTATFTTPGFADTVVPVGPTKLGVKFDVVEVA